MADLRVQMLWVPPWDGPLREDLVLQEKAADRLVEYFLNGRIYTGERLIRGMTAERVKLDGRSERDKSVIPWAVRFGYDLEVTVK